VVPLSFRAVIYSPSTGLVGTSTELFMTRYSTGALMSLSGRWKSRGALNSVPEEMVCPRRILPWGLTAIVLTSRSTGLTPLLNCHIGISGLTYTPVKSKFPLFVPVLIVQLSYGVSITIGGLHNVHIYYVPMS